MLSPMSLVLRRVNSSLRLWNSVNSVEHTGVKSAGWLNSITHLPSCHLLKLRSPWVVIAVKSGARSPMRGMPPLVVQVSILGSWFGCSGVTVRE